MAYWLFKSEPDEYSIDDLRNEPAGVGVWDGIRNYQARNFLRDQVAVGDEVLFYHSSCKQVGIAGTAEVVRAAYPDPAQFNPESRYFAISELQKDQVADYAARKGWNTEEAERWLGPWLGYGI